MSHEQDWLSQMGGKTINAVRPTHPNGPVPQVRLGFTDGTEFIISPKRGVYFEGCLINTLRKAAPVTDVLIERDGTGTMLSLGSRTFPLLVLMAVNKGLPSSEFPFVIAAAEGAVA
jgi:hypothetical protein